MMFKTRTAANATLDARLAELSSTNESWFDGSVESVDRRIAQVSQARHAARGHLDPELPLSLEASLGELKEMRTALLEGDLDETPAITASIDHYRQLPQRIRDELTVQSKRFVASNADAVDNQRELMARAGFEGKRVAETLVQTADARQLVAEAFVYACYKTAERTPRAKPKRDITAAAADFVEGLVDDIVFW